MTMLVLHHKHPQRLISQQHLQYLPSSTDVGGQYAQDHSTASSTVNCVTKDSTSDS